MELPGGKKSVGGGVDKKPVTRAPPAADAPTKSSGPPKKAQSAAPSKVNPEQTQ